MKIFANSRALETLFRAGNKPESETLLGPNGEPCEWTVEMLTGPIPDMGGKRLRHRKVFERPAANGNVRDGNVRGCNINCSNVHWGAFYVSLSSYNDGDYSDEKPVAYLVYNGGSITRRICDMIRTTNDPNVLIGKFFYKWRGRYRFLGYFTLTRIQPKAVA